MALAACPIQGGFFGMMGFGWIFQILIFVIFFLVVWWLIRTDRAGRKEIEGPGQILKRRLAKGEITKKEYDILRKEIED